MRTERAAEFSVLLAVAPAGRTFCSMNQPTDRLFDAIEFAAQHHRGQFRKGTRIPYVTHLLGVCRILAEFDFEEDVLIGGLLHDVIEDTNASLADVETRFGKTVASIVNGTTEPEKHEKLSATAEKDSWRRRKQHTIDYVNGETDEHRNLEILAVSAADKLDNARAMLHDLRREGESFWGRFNAPKADQQWYYENLAKAFLAQSKSYPALAPIAEELNKTAKELFDL